MPDPLLSVKDLSVQFHTKGGVVHAARGVSYDVAPGEFLALVGESGCGKSVSALAVMGLLPATARVSGKAIFQGEDLLTMSDKHLSKLRGAAISMVFQDPLQALTPVYTVGDQIAEALELHDKSLSKRDAADRAVQLLDAVGIPQPDRRAKAFPHEFSGGMRQRVMIAMAIANDPDLIVADEPTTALDVTIQAQILDLLQKARELTGAAIVFITHDLGVVAGNADRVAVMYAGRIVETGAVEPVMTAPTMPYTIGLMRSVPNMLTAGETRLVPLEGRPPKLVDLAPGCPFAPRCPAAMDTCREVEPPLSPIAGADDERLAACHLAEGIASGKLPRSAIFPVPDPLPRHRAEHRDIVLSVRDLTRHFPLTKGHVFRRTIGTVRAVDGVSFDIGAGETLGLVGESGCGKTTTATQILELDKPQSGSIEVLGKDTGALTRSERLALRSQIQVVFQDPMASLDPRMLVGDIVAEPLTVGDVPRRERAERVATMLELVGLDADFAQRYPHEFSGGQRQRIGIARALITGPKIVVLDEPVSALDVSVQAGVINLLEDLKVKLGLTYLFVAHDLAVVRQISDRVAVMYLGRIVEIGDVRDVLRAPQHPYSQALISAAPIPDPAIERTRKRILLTGELPSPTQTITGCPFRSRCPRYRELSDDVRTRCETEAPALQARAGEKRLVACHAPMREAS